MKLCAVLVWVFATLKPVSGFVLSAAERSRELRGSDFAVEKVKNFHQCKALCDSRSLCSSFNYNTMTKDCTSNLQQTTNTKPQSLDVSPGVVYEAKSYKSKNSLLCGKHRCNDNEVCFTLGHSQKCFKEEINCRSPPNVENTRKVTNGTLLHSQSTYTCTAGYTTVKGKMTTSTTSTCGRNRKWTPINLSCIVDCGTPTFVLTGGVMKSVSTTLGSSASLVCDEYFRFFGNSPTMTCDKHGKWTGLDGQCKQIEWRNQHTAFNVQLPAQMEEGWNMIFAGIAGDVNSEFFINFKHGTVYYMHMIVKFSLNGNRVSFNWTVDDDWSTEVTLKRFLFSPGGSFRIVISLKGKILQITVDGEHLYDFALPSSANLITHLVIEDNVSIDAIKFVYADGNSN